MEILHYHGREKSSYPEPVKEAIALIEENYPDPEMNLEMLSGKVGLSKYYFIRLFRRHTGTTPGRYIRNHRLERAIQLLTLTNYPIKELSAMVGYPNHVHFSHAFKKQFGKTPGEMRPAS